jgi:hypothetical protein
LCHVLILYTGIVVSIYNLTVESENSTLWTALLSSCLGYLLPNPTIKTFYLTLPSNSSMNARLILQTATPRFCRSCLKIQLLKDSWYPSHLTKYWTLRPFFLFLKMGSGLTKRRCPRGYMEERDPQNPVILSQRRPRWNSGRNILCRRITESH